VLTKQRRDVKIASCKVRSTHNTKAKHISPDAVFAAVSDKVARKICLGTIEVDHFISSDVCKLSCVAAAAVCNLGETEVRDLRLEVRSQQNVCTTYILHRI